MPLDVSQYILWSEIFIQWTMVVGVGGTGGVV
jgi:hypothetical protein